MGHPKLFYLGMILLQLFTLSACANEDKSGVVAVPCPDHIFCWYYCQLTINAYCGAGCCWDRKYKDEKGTLVTLPSLAKSCWCCTAPSAISLAQPAVDVFCNNIYNATSVTSLVDSLCLVKTLSISCRLVKVNLSLSLLDVGAGCKNSTGSLPISLNILDDLTG